MSDAVRAVAKAADRLDRAHADRDQAIIDARAADATVVAIAAAARLSRSQVHRILAAARGSEAGGAGASGRQAEEV